MALATKKSWVG